MKRIFAALLSMILLLSCAAAEFNDFALLEKLHVSGKNTVFSPLSLYAALGMAADGAEGLTRDELLAVIGEAASGEIKSANAAFLAPDVSLTDTYQAILHEKYAAGHFPIDKDVVEKVNSWVSEKTGGMIEKMLDCPPEMIGLMLVNAVAMDQEWLHPFKKDATSEEDFFAPGETLSVQMMHQTEHFAYAERDGAQIICLPYKDSSLEMWIALPADGGMEDLLSNLAAEGMDYLTADALSREVILSLPKADVTDENDLVPVLKQLGVNLAFSDAADFSAMSETPLFISGVIQKARMMMDEESTRAAAATMIMMAKGAMMETEVPVEMKINRPYFFAVRDSETGAVCFTGVIENPA